MSKHLVHVHSNDTTLKSFSNNPSTPSSSASWGKRPTSSQIEKGEIAVNYNPGNEVLTIRNNNDQIVGFLPEDVLYEDEKIIAQGFVQLEQNKQDKLTAGDNISINNNIISATVPTFAPGDSSVTISGTTISVNKATNGGLAVDNNGLKVDTTTIATKSDLNSKQGTLTAGNFINIDAASNNTISVSENLDMFTSFMRIFNGNEISTKPGTSVMGADTLQAPYEGATYSKNDDNLRQYATEGQVYSFSKPVFLLAGTVIKIKCSTWGLNALDEPVRFVYLGEKYLKQFEWDLNNGDYLTMSKVYTNNNAGMTDYISWTVSHDGYYVYGPWVNIENSDLKIILDI